MKLMGCRNLILLALALSGMVGLAERPLVAQANAAPPTVSVLRNSGLAQMVWPGDFNGDGITDLASTAPRQPGAPPSPVVIALGRGDGTFSTPTPTGFTGSVVGVTDVSGDGKADLLVVGDDPAGATLFFALGNGDGTFTSTRTVATLGGVEFALIADLDGDGIKDVVAGGPDDTIQIYAGHADGSYASAATLAGGIFIHGGIVADFNGDGRKDLAIANHYGRSVTIFLNQGAFNFLATDVAVGLQANDVTAGDLNGDGKIDLVVAMSGGGDSDTYFTEGGAGVLLGHGDGTFDAVVTYDVPRGGWLAVVGDFNRDGITDIATANRSSIYYDDCGPSRKTWDSLSILAGRGDGTFAAAVNFSIGNQSDLDGTADRNSVVSLKTSDLNGDRATDLIVSDGTVFLNRPVDPNRAPAIDLSESSATSDAVLLRAKVTDDDQDMVTYTWTSNDGIQIGPVPNPCIGSWATPGTHTYTLTVDDGRGHQASASVSFTVGSGGGPGPTLSMIAPADGSTIASGEPYTIKFHVEDPSMALYEWSIDYSVDNGATWNHIWECHNAGQSSQPGVPTSRDESCTWVNPGPAATQAMLVVYAQNDADASIGTAANARFIIATPSGHVPYPWLQQDVGAVAKAGATTYSNGVFRASGSGADIWGAADEFHYTYVDAQSSGVEGTGEIDVVAHVDSVGNVNAWTKAGVMIRAGLDASSAHASFFVSPSKGIAFQRRLTSGAASISTGLPGVTAPVWLRLVTEVNEPNQYVRAYYKKNASDPWTQFAQDAFPGVIWQPFGGVAVSSHADGTLATAAFSSVTVAHASAWRDASIGKTGGQASIAGDTFTLQGTGADIWGTSDQFEYVYQQCAGNCTITAHVASLQNTNQWAKAGVMFRELLDANSKQVDMIVSPLKGAAMQYRTATGGVSASAGASAGAAPGWVRLVRRGSVFTGFWSADGVTFAQVGSVTVVMNSTIWVGLAATSHNPTTAATAQFDGVTVSQP